MNEAESSGRQRRKVNKQRIDEEVFEETRIRVVRINYIDTFNREKKERQRSNT